MTAAQTVSASRPSEETMPSPVIATRPGGHTDMVVSTMHVHLNHDNCLEVIVLRGRAGALPRVASELRGRKGIHKGQLVLASTADTA